MPSSFADLVFTGERIEVGLKRGKFDYVSPVGASSRRTGIAGVKKKKGDAHTVTSTPAWSKLPQTPHSTHQYAQHHLSFTARAGGSSDTALTQPRAPTPPQGGGGVASSCSGSNPASLGQQCSPWRKPQHGEELFAKANSDFHPDPNDIWGTLAISNCQPIGCSDFGKGPSVSVPKVV